MKCFRCHKEIEKKGQYYAMTEYSKGIKVRTDYVHRTCWDSFMKSLDKATASLDKSNYLLDAMGKFMKENNIIKEEAVYEVK